MRFSPSPLLAAGAVLLTLLAGCQSRTSDTATTAAAPETAPTDTILPPAPNDGITATGIGSYIKVLASDAYQGRKPFTIGEQKTTTFLANEFKKLGLKPGPDGTYFQAVPLVEITGMPAPTMQIGGGKQPLTLNYKTDYMAFTEQEKEQVALTNSPLVFAGYGVVAPEYGWNDYAGLDVKGKTVVVLVNDPGNAENDTTMFKGHAMTYYGRWMYKYEEAARQGAAGLLIIHDTKPAAYPWSVVQSSYSGAKLRPQTADRGASKCALEGWLTLDAAKKIFQAAGQSYDEAYAAANKKGFRARPLNLTLSTSIRNKLRRQTSKNVVAVLPGTTRPDEYIIYSAHWDHLGIGAPVNGDSIYNGAADNASGCAALLSIAKAFQQAKEKPARSIVFLAVTGEEQGLLGSMYYASHPLFPVHKTVADLNMDDLPNMGPMRDLTVIGYGQSELDDYARTAAQEQRRYIQPDQNADKGYFFRSDHFSLAHVGIPSLYASGQSDNWFKGKAFAQKAAEAFEANTYHQPSDEYSPTADYRGMEQDARLLFRVGQRLASETTFPQWKAGSEFKAIREKSMAGK
ncbi:Zn-dependent amino-or carboxypeptidase, M28 family [Hymenobacter daecheongensis DSM 21074]|uniref:Zn-dependent amino-or carboxypeptidase, M28 family n=1 Tax=Hymenobacter daecheongensis DSM 21074 TaxID=1121955 RepID=A0A1M6BC34_9BACT|nr:M28 family metallopeptidase [Hymenobacter daecheongensis]SHI46289.1 Zn-dependent amino-or carboxypeptidase, M28 family [Hymenobacter daecheongensis DSM 21074]